MKILIATGIFPPDVGGPATYSKLLSEELPKIGVATDVLSFGSVRKLPKGISHVTYFLKLLWHARAVDAIFAQDTVSVGLPAYFAAFVLGKPFMVRIPGDYAWEQAFQRYGVTDTIDAFQTKPYGGSVKMLRRIQKFVVGHADVAIAPSKYFAKLANNWIGSEDKVLHIYNGVDVAAIEAASAGTTREPKTIITAGRLVLWKGFTMLIEAMVGLPDWKLSIAGDGPCADELRSLIAKLNIGDRVTMLGQLDRAELIARVAQAEIFALNTGFESFSFQVVEAMATGVPVITTDVGDLTEIVEDGQSGVLIPPNDKAAFIAAVKRLSQDKALEKRLGEGGKLRSKSFSIGTTVEAVKGQLTKAMGDFDVVAKRRITIAKLIRYLFSGGVAAVTDIVLLYIFTDLLHIWYVISSVLAFLLAFFVSFFLQKFFTFQDHDTDGVKGQAFLYFIVTGINLLLNTVLIYAFVKFTGLNYILSQIVTSIAIAIESFIIYKMFIFTDAGDKKL